MGVWALLHFWQVFLSDCLFASYIASLFISTFTFSSSPLWFSNRNVVFVGLATRPIKAMNSKIALASSSTASVFHSVNFDLRQAVDRILLGSYNGEILNKKTKNNTTSIMIFMCGFFIQISLLKKYCCVCWIEINFIKSNLNIKTSKKDLLVLKRDKVDFQ